MTRALVCISPYSRKAIPAHCFQRAMQTAALAPVAARYRANVSAILPEEESVVALKQAPASNNRKDRVARGSLRLCRSISMDCDNELSLLLAFQSGSIHRCNQAQTELFTTSKRRGHKALVAAEVSAGAPPMNLFGTVCAIDARRLSLAVWLLFKSRSEEH